MIIFGTRSKTRTVDEGRFFCPRCNAERAYQRKQARPYFALYFIPVFPVGQGSEYIECQTCGMAFEPGVLQMTLPGPRQDLAGMMNTIRSRLEQGVPVEYVIRDLTAAGLEYDVARAAVNAQVGPERSVCQTCGLAYVPGVKVCAECQGALQSST